MSKKQDTSTNEQTLELNVQESEKVETEKKVESKPTLSKDKTVKIQNVKLANQKTKTVNEILEFDSNGIVEVNGEVAEYLLRCSKNFVIVK